MSHSTSCHSNNCEDDEIDDNANANNSDVDDFYGEVWPKGQSKVGHSIPCHSDNCEDDKNDDVDTDDNDIDDYDEVHNRVRLKLATVRRYTAQYWCIMKMTKLMMTIMVKEYAASKSVEGDHPQPGESPGGG